MHFIVDVGAPSGNINEVLTLQCDDFSDVKYLQEGLCVEFADCRVSWINFSPINDYPVDRCGYIDFLSTRTF